MSETCTRYFGKVIYYEEDVIHFKNGLYGFENEKDFIIMNFDSENSAVLCLQSVATEDLAFVIMDPFAFFPDYAPSITEAELSLLGAEEEQDLACYVICVIRDDLEDSTANLKCPVFVNPMTHNAMQAILEDTSYAFKHSFKEFMRKEEAVADANPST